MTIEIDFEEPPPIARRSEYLELLLALKQYPGESARIKKDVALSAAGAAQLAGVVSRAATKIGDGYDVVTRFIPAVDHHGVWVTYQPAPDDEPGIPTAEARAEAKGIIDEAMTPAYRKDAIPVEATEVDPGQDAWDTAMRDADVIARTGA